MGPQTFSHLRLECFLRRHSLQMRPISERDSSSSGMMREKKGGEGYIASVCVRVPSTLWIPRLATSQSLVLFRLSPLTSFPFMSGRRCTIRSANRFRCEPRGVAFAFPGWQNPGRHLWVIAWRPIATQCSFHACLARPLCLQVLLTIAPAPSGLRAVTNGRKRREDPAKTVETWWPVGPLRQPRVPPQCLNQLRSFYRAPWGFSIGWHVQQKCRHDDMTGWDLEGFVFVPVFRRYSLPTLGRYPVRSSRQFLIRSPWRCSVYRLLVPRP